MAEVLAKFPETVVGSDGVRYEAQATGMKGTLGHWEAWVEFLPLNGGAPIRTGRETTQTNHTDAVSWARGLSTVYLEGALERALRPLVVGTPEPAQPMFDQPAPAFHAVLDPFSVFEKGESLLRSELGALSSWHLVNIVIAHHLSDQSEAALNRLSAEELMELIVKAVRQQAPVHR